MPINVWDYLREYDELRDEILATVDRVFRSGRHIYAQVIDDGAGKTLAYASSLDKDLREKLKTSADKAAASAVGKLVAQRAIAAGVKDVVFDRGRYLYHGRVKAVADGAREGGLNF